MKSKKQHKSLAVITVMETKDNTVVITSEGTGGAGELADALVQLLSDSFHQNRRQPVDSTPTSG